MTPTRRLRMTLAALLIAAGNHAIACSYGCAEDPAGYHPSTTIRVSLEGDPLPGAAITVWRSDHPNGEVFAGPAGQDGSLRLPSLRPGQYTLEVDYLGISAGYHCFRIDRHPAPNAKRLIEFHWGEHAALTRNMAGHVIESLPGTGPNRLLNQVQRIRAPLGGAGLTLIHARSGNTLHARTASDGSFTFGDVPPATYVLRLTAGPRETKIVVRHKASAPSEDLPLLLGDLCGGPSLVIDPPQRNFTR